MTTEAEIHEQINAMYNKFWQSPYEGRIPEGLMNKFREAIMFHSAISLKGSPQVIRDLLAMKEYDLKFLHVGIIINTLFPVPFNAMFYSPEEAMEALIEYKDIEVEYNHIVEKKSKEIERARNKKLEICGFKNTATLTAIPGKN